MNFGTFNVFVIETLHRDMNIDIDMSRWADRTSDPETIVQFVKDTLEGVCRPKALLFLGAGGEGKTTLIDEIRALVGQENTACVRSHSDMRVACRPSTKLVLLAEPEYDVGRAIEGLLKLLMNRDDLIDYRPLYAAGSTFKPSWNVIFALNSLEGLSPSVLRRCEIINFQKPPQGQGSAPAESQ